METSIDALKTVDVAGAHQHVFAFLASNPVTVEDLVRRTGIRIQTGAARVSELHAAGLIHEVGRRPTSSGCDATVWGVVPGKEDADVRTLRRPPLLRMPGIDWGTGLDLVRRWLASVAEPAECPACGHRVRPGKVKR